MYRSWILCDFFFFFLMIRLPPRSTRTDTLFPYTTLFRSHRREYSSRIGEIPHETPMALATYTPTRGYLFHLRLPSSRRKMRSEEHTSELQSLMRISYAVFCLKKNNIYTHTKLKTNQLIKNHQHLTYTHSNHN